MPRNWCFVNLFVTYNYLIYYLLTHQERTTKSSQRKQGKEDETNQTMSLNSSPLHADVKRMQTQTPNLFADARGDGIYMPYANCCFVNIFVTDNYFTTSSPTTMKTRKRRKKEPDTGFKLESPAGRRKESVNLNTPPLCLHMRGDGLHMRHITEILGGKRNLIFQANDLGGKPPTRAVI